MKNEYNIGDTITIGGVTYEVEAPSKCDSCAFKDMDCSEMRIIIGECDGRARKCKDDIVFVERKDEDRPMFLTEFRKLISEAMYRFAESNCTGIELRCRVDLRPSLQGAEFNMYNFNVIIGDGLKND